ncbi:MAG: DNA polymerase IV [Halobacteria archaeon]
MPNRIIFHVDMDSFYASVELLDHPEYRGRPLVVGADPKEGRGRGVVLTASYEARPAGVRSGMPISRAWKLLPGGLYVRPRFERYEEVSRQVMGVLRGFADKFEPVSIDEAFLDVTARTGGDWGRAEALAGEVKGAVRERVGLTCTVGIAPSKLVAKIASDRRKPDGLTAVKPGEEEAFLAPLPVRSLPGIGPKSEARLLAMGIERLEQLARADPEALRREFGVWGPRFTEEARGVDPGPVEESTEIKSIGREGTLEEDTGDMEQVRATLRGLADEVAAAARAQGLAWRTATLKVRFSSFDTHTRSTTTRQPREGAGPLAEAVLRLADIYREEVERRKVRHLGVRVSALSPAGRQKTLMDG